MRFQFDDLPVIDNHCHPFPLGRVPAVIENTWTISLNALPTQDIRNSVYFQMSTAEMCRYHGIADVDAMLRHRQEQYEADPKAYTQALWRDANVQALLADVGSPVTNKRLTEQELQEFAWLNDSLDLHYINRIERVTDDLLPLALPFDDFVSRFLQDTRELIQAQHLLALKSIIAYRTGLAIEALPESQVRQAYARYLLSPSDKAAEKVIRDFIFLTSAQLCRELGMVLQLHTGAGDSPLSDLRINSALLLYDALNDPRCRDTKLMLVHAGNPDVEHAAYLVGHYANVYLDLSSMLPYFGHAVEDKLRAILAFAPTTKILYGSDGGGIPDHHWFAAKYFKRALSRVMERFVNDQILRETFVEETARNILSENARMLYNI